MCPAVLLTRDVTVGRAGIINYGGHDWPRQHDRRRRVHRPGAHLAGNVRVDAQAEVGIGASIIQGMTIGGGVGGRCWRRRDRRSGGGHDRGRRTGSAVGALALTGRATVDGRDRIKRGSRHSSGSFHPRRSTSSPSSGRAQGRHVAGRPSAVAGQAPPALHAGTVPTRTTSGRGSPVRRRSTAATTCRGRTSARSMSRTWTTAACHGSPRPAAHPVGRAATRRGVSPTGSATTVPFMVSEPTDDQRSDAGGAAREG